MWVRRLPEEILAIQRRKHCSRYSPLYPLTWAAAAACVFVILSWIGYHGKFRPMTPPTSFGEAVAIFPFAFALLFIAFYLCRVFGVFRETKPTMICTHCHIVQAASEEGHCACGGELEPLQYWAWEEDKPRLVP
jgi:hypothetical protein